MIDNADAVLKDFPKLTEGKTKLQIHNSFNMEDDDFAITIGNKIYINNYAFRNRNLLNAEYNKKLEEKWFVAGTSYKSIIHHELGHVVTNVYGLSPIKIAKEVTKLNNKQIIDFVENNLSKYSAVKYNGREIISEVFAGIYSETDNKFALKFYAECVKIILKRGGTQ